MIKNEFMSTNVSCVDIKSSIQARIMHEVKITREKPRKR